jgi:hypothetical protein
MNQGIRTFFQHSFFKSKWWVVVPGIYWIAAILSEHFHHLPEYASVFRRFAYWDFLILYLLTGLGFLLLLSRGDLTFPLKIPKFRGIYVPLFLFLSLLLLVGFYTSKNNLEAPLMGYALRSGKVFLSMGLLLLSSWAAGHRILSGLKPLQETAMVQWIKVGLGLLLLSLVLFLLAVLHWFQPYVLALVVLLPLVFGGFSFWRLCKHFLWDAKTVEGWSKTSLGVYLGVQVLVLANLLAVSSPVPLGFDSLTLYMNLPKVIAEQGALAQGYQPHYWSLIMSLGFALWDSTMLVLHLGMLPGVLATFLLYGLARLYLGPTASVLAAGLYYSLPMVLWQSSFEIKTDLGMLYFALCGLALVFSAYAHGGKLAIFKEKWKIWMLAGLFCGLALGIKLTAFLLIAALGVTLVYWHMGLPLAMAALSWIVAGIFAINLSDFANLDLSALERYALVGSLAALGSVLLILNKKRLGAAFQGVLLNGSLFAGGILLMMLPWLLNNALEGRNWVTGQQAEKEEIRMGMRPSLMSDQEATLKEVLVPSGKKEEINRYLGYEGGLMRFISLPYDLTFQKNVALFATEVGLFFLALLPLLLLGPTSGVFNLLRFLLLLLVLSLSWLSVHDMAGEMSFGQRMELLASASFWHKALLSPVLLLGTMCLPLYRLLTQFTDGVALMQWMGVGILFVLGLSTYFSKRLGPKKDLFLFVAVYFFLWVILSSGIPWYGMVGFAILPILLVESEGVGVWRNWVRLVAFLWLILIVPFKLSPLALKKSENIATLDFRQWVPAVNLLYASGALSHAQSMEKVHNLPTRQMIQLLNAQPEAVVLNLGTMLRYYIQNNERRLFDDNQLDLFYSLWINSGRSKVATANRLRQLGVDYILLDLDVHTLDVTLDGSLRAKVEEFVEFMYRNERVDLLYTDRLVEHPSGDQNMEIEGRIVPIKYGLFGLSIVEKGKYALLKIKS